MLTYSLLAVAITITTIVIFAVFLRRVVPTNTVHIVQSSKQTVSYGKGKPSGNVYYEFPEWIPRFGITKIILPVSVFDINLNSYEAYDKDRVAFVVDITAFFRIDDSNMSAERVSSFNELNEQLLVIVQGAVRTVLAQHNIDEIMLKRSTFNEMFTNEVQEQLKDWGVVPVKNIELMDIRDDVSSDVIKNIMEKKKSFIEMESRKEVAENIKNAEVAEIEARREATIKNEQALEAIGKREAEKEQVVGVSKENAKQQILSEAKVTSEKKMDVERIEDVKRAEIDKERNIVKATEQRESIEIVAKGEFEAKQHEANGIEAEGLALAVSEKEMQLASVQAQITLAVEIGENDAYQKYLVDIRGIEAQQVVGVEQAKALKDGDLKVIVNSGDAVEGVNNMMDIFSSKGGTGMASMIEGVTQSDMGKQLINKFIAPKNDTTTE